MYKLYFSTSTGKLRCDYSDFRKSIKEIRKHEKETKFEIHTDKETVGADYDKDGVYWAFYENGQYASSGVDSTPVKEGGSFH